MKTPKIVSIGLPGKYKMELISNLELADWSFVSFDNSVDAMIELAKENTDFCLINMNVEHQKWQDIVKFSKSINPRIINIVLYDGAEKSEIELIRDGAENYVSMDKSAVVCALMIKTKNIDRENNTSKKNEFVLSNGMKIDLVSRTVADGERIENLTGTECSVLNLLISNQGKTVSREDIFHHISPGVKIEGSKLRSVDMHVVHLRGKIGYTSIATVRGRGYYIN